MNYGGINANANAKVSLINARIFRLVFSHSKLAKVVDAFRTKNSENKFQLFTNYYPNFRVLPEMACRKFQGIYRRYVLMTFLTSQH